MRNCVGEESVAADKQQKSPSSTRVASEMMFITPYIRLLSTMVTQLKAVIGGRAFVQYTFQSYMLCG